jgi:hypothetical protein
MFPVLKTSLKLMTIWKHSEYLQMKTTDAVLQKEDSVNKTVMNTPTKKCPRKRQLTYSQAQDSVPTINFRGTVDNSIFKSHV